MLKNKFLTFLRYVFLVLFSLIMIFPFYWMLIASFKTQGEAIAYPPTLIPNSWTLDNYIDVLTRTDIILYLGNSVFISALELVLCLSITILAAFATSHFDFKHKKLFFGLLISTSMVPVELLFIINYKTIVSLNLYDTYIAVILPFIASVYYTLLLYNNFCNMSNKLYNAAQIDGCSNFRYAVKILLPSSKPVILSIGLLNVISSWNSFMWPMLMIHTPSKRTWPFGLFTFATETWTNIPAVCATETLSILPMLLLFIFSRKYIFKSFTNKL